MKQPKITIFGETHPVRLIEFNNEGNISKASYVNKHGHSNTVFRDKKVTCSIKNVDKVISEPTRHPWHNWILAPDLESLITWEE